MGGRSLRRANREIDAIPLSPDLVMVRPPPPAFAGAGLRRGRLDRTNGLPRTVLTDVFMPMAGSSPAKTFPSPEGRPTGRCGTRNDGGGASQGLGSQSRGVMWRKRAGVEPAR